MLLPILLLNIQILTFKLCRLELKAHSIIACYNYDSFDIRNYIYIYVCIYVYVCVCVIRIYINMHIQIFKLFQVYVHVGIRIINM